MIQGASDQIVVVGYVFTEGALPLVELLAVAQNERHVRVIIIGNRMQEQLPLLMQECGENGRAIAACLQPGARCR